MSSVATAQDTWDALLCEVDRRGNRRWFDADGKLHRENGPALLRFAGTQLWFKHGKFHREDGPAVIDDDWLEYWVDGKQMSEEEFNARKLTING